ncbi:MAG: hypothetical protein ACYTFY_18770, partial [Planctomycetota bacterium]
MSGLSQNEIVSKCNVNFSGKTLKHSLWEEKAYPDMPEVYSLKKGDTLKGEFSLQEDQDNKDFVNITLFGYPASSVSSRKEIWDIYIGCKIISPEIEILINGKSVYRDLLFLRSHPDTGIGQYSYLNIRKEEFNISGSSVNTFEIRNITSENTDTAVQDYFLINAKISYSSGKLVNDIYQPDSLDKILEKQENSELLCGAGYELIQNSNVPAMIKAVKEDKTGNFILFRIDNALNNGSRATAEDLISWAELCTASQIYFSFLTFRAPEHSL